MKKNENVSVPNEKKECTANEKLVNQEINRRRFAFIAGALGGVTTINVASFFHVFKMPNRSSEALSSTLQTEGLLFLMGFLMLAAGSKFKAPAVVGGGASLQFLMMSFMAASCYLFMEGEAYTAKPQTLCHSNPRFNG